MAYAFDTLGFSQRLQQSGVAREQADGPAQAVREFVMQDLVTKADLQVAVEILTLRLTIRVASIVIATAGALGTAIGLLNFFLLKH